MKALVTGGAGFFGGLLKRRLLADGHECVSVDLVPDEDRHESLLSVRGDVRDQAELDAIFAQQRFDVVFHCAAVLAHAVKSRRFLWTSNVVGTRVVAECARRHGVKSLVFTSSNCVWSRNFDEPVRETEPTGPVEIYGRSKLEAERVLAEYAGDLAVITLRTPTIVDEGRLGLLAILFEFIDEGRRVWVVGDGQNVYQFLYAPDLIDACLKAAESGKSALYHVGSDRVRPLREVYQHVIDEAGTGARIVSLPERPALWAMRAAHGLGVSPLGPYQYRMITNSFVFDTSRIREDLGWRPTLANEEMLAKAYRYFHAHNAEIRARNDVSAHRQAAKMGIIRLIKWVS